MAACLSSPRPLTVLCPAPPHSAGVPAPCVLLEPSGVAERRNSSGVRLAAGVAAPPGVRSGEAGSCPAAGKPKENSAEGEEGWGAPSLLAAAGRACPPEDARAASARRGARRGVCHVDVGNSCRRRRHAAHQLALPLPLPQPPQSRRRRPSCHAACCAARDSTAACAASRCCPRAPV